MKLLLIVLLLTTGSCANFNISNFNMSESRCDNKVGIEKEQCVESYNNFVRHLEYKGFRGSGRDRY